ncbi:MAG: hypothetical protein VKQ33_01850 [Candidatus Sericytochromatia bacterium]|nr:hypothetical protein [Candidatus Sericytochromatia bacterium]
MSDHPTDEALQRRAWAHKAWAATHQAPPEVGWHWREAVRAEDELHRRREARDRRPRP